MKRFSILRSMAILLITFNCTTEKKETKEYFMIEGNPLFNEFNQAHDFGSLTADHFTEAADTIIARSKSEFEKIYAIPDEDRTFENTMLAYDNIINDFLRISDINYLMAYTHPDSLIRSTALELNNKLEKYGNEMSLDENLYNAIKAYSKTEEAQSLTGYKAKFLKDEIESFERNGFALPKDKRDELKVVKDEISEIGNSFDQNIASYQDYLIATEKDVDGLSEDYKKARKQEDGTYKIDLSYPSYIPFMKYSTSDQARKELYMKYNNRAADSNLDVLLELLKKRKEMANMLGFKTYAEWRTADRMVKNPETVWDFENDLIESVKQKADLDFQEMLDAKKEYIGVASEMLTAWEASYVDNIMLENKYQLDEEEVKQYFPLDNVLDGLFKITQTIFNVTYREIENPSVWYEDVRAFEVMDNGKVVGRFYLDLFPRDNKYKHAACFGMIKGKMMDGVYQIPNATLVCNFPAPTEDKPSLMPHGQVETLFHEFGHVLHQMLTRAELSIQSGTSVARDFVEAPSQIFENWAWNYESLQMFAKHWETGETLPQELYDKMMAAKNVGSGLSTEGQIYYGLVDFTLHDKFDPYGEKGTDEVTKELKDRITHYPFVDGTHFQAAFGHLNGYGASYYGYMWSRVYAEDMFSIFAQNGVLDQETGMRYRDIILAKGGSEEPMELVKQFLGRDPNNKAFMKSLGL